LTRNGSAIRHYCLGAIISGVFFAIKKHVDCGVVTCQALKVSRILTSVKFFC
jgi:hypothetical protein